MCGTKSRLWGHSRPNVCLSLFFSLPAACGSTPFGSVLSEVSHVMCLSLTPLLPWALVKNFILVQESKFKSPTLRTSYHPGATLLQCCKLAAPQQPRDRSAGLPVPFTDTFCRQECNRQAWKPLLHAAHYQTPYNLREMTSDDANWRTNVSPTWCARNVNPKLIHWQYWTYEIWANWGHRVSPKKIAL